MQIVNKNPPIFDKIIAAGLLPSETCVFTYGDTIFNPSGVSIPPDVEIHEEMHQEQQGDNPDAWWSKYLTDPKFRIHEEAEAYGEQYRFICKSVRDREKRNGILLQLAYHLCGPIYGQVINHMEAYRLIKEKSKV